jgi:hypothetical protein
MLIENAELAAAGPTARMTETMTCANPFVAPMDAGLGEAAAIYINAMPYTLNNATKSCQRV